LKPTFFATPEKFREWLERNHAGEKELLVGFYKTDSGKPSITWPQSVDQALCFGWIDGVRKRIDDVSYTIRFTPRKATSIWSKINIDKVAELKKKKLMHPAGLAAFDKRSDEKSAIYSYEQRKKAKLSKDQFDDDQAWEFYSSQAPWYQRATAHWVLSAKKEETRQKRLALLIKDSRRRRRIGLLTPPSGRRAGA
jgi:uncharacterized protein YdeI (YjbR/CyaY-like superfamily)